MIGTRSLHSNPTIVLHRVSGRLNENQALTGASEALAVVRKLLKTTATVHLILDMRGYAFDNLKAHRIWSTEFKLHPLIKEHVKRVSVIGDDSPKFRAEKKVMETDSLRFFLTLEPALNWLKDN